jgi:hypothetical protein
VAAGETRSDAGMGQLSERKWGTHRRRRSRTEKERPVPALVDRPAAGSAGDQGGLSCAHADGSVDDHRPSGRQQRMRRSSTPRATLSVRSDRRRLRCASVPTPSKIPRLLWNGRIESRDDVSESSDIRAETSDARSESSASVSSLRHIRPRVVSGRLGVLGRPPSEP